MNDILAVAFIVIAAVAICAVLFGSWFNRIRWPIMAFLGSWTLTTGLAAAYFATPTGLADLKDFLAHAPPELDAVVVSPVYAVLLIVPLLAVPMGGLLGGYIGMRIFGWPSLAPLFRQVRISGALLFGLILLALAFCLWRLALHDALLPGALFDASTGYESNMQARARLMSDLGYFFYAVFYAFIPSIAALFLAAAIEKKSIFNIFLYGFIFSYMLFYYLSVVTYLKAPFLYLTIVLVAVAWFSKISWPRKMAITSGLGAIAVASFLSMQALLGGTPAVSTTESAMESTTKSGKERIEERGWLTSRRKSSPSAIDRFDNFARHVAKSATFRMATAFPFYVSTFEDPNERCGIEIVPGRTRCDLPTKVFKKMYPTINFVTGFAPAAAHVSAYGEVGLPYALLVACLVGVVIGGFAMFASQFSGIIAVALNAVAIIFAYFLSQVPFVGAFDYGHGLIPFLVPVAAAVAGSRLLEHFGFNRDQADAKEQVMQDVSRL